MFIYMWEANFQGESLREIFHRLIPSSNDLSGWSSADSKAGVRSLFEVSCMGAWNFSHPPLLSQARGRDLAQKWNIGGTNQHPYGMLASQAEDKPLCYHSGP